MSHTAFQPIHGHYLMPPLRHATVADAMHPGIVSCPADATLTDVARLMATHHVHCIAVMGISHDRQGEDVPQPVDELLILGLEPLFLVLQADHGYILPSRADPCRREA